MGSVYGRRAGRPAFIAAATADDSLQRAAQSEPENVHERSPQVSATVEAHTRNTSAGATLLTRIHRQPCV